LGLVKGSGHNFYRESFVGAGRSKTEFRLLDMKLDTPELLKHLFESSPLCLSPLDCTVDIRRVLTNRDGGGIDSASLSDPVNIEIRSGLFAL
jgi:hypothetical protein